MPDTIASIATASAPGGIGIVRVSGTQALSVARTVFRPLNAFDWDKVKGYTMLFGAVRSAEGEIDEAICLLFRGPKSYTGEDVAELHCHGGPYLLLRIQQAALDAGARLAEPGEFTRRAWLNGRIQLTQAEAVMRLIYAQSEQALRAAHGAMGGALIQKIAAVRGDLIALAAHISAWTDYPEEDIPPVIGDEAEAVLRKAETELSQLLHRSKGAAAVLEGVSAALVGRPNVGKSALLNRMAGYDRAIVADIPGTTRDTVTESVQLGNLTLRLTDTAGIRDTEHPVEKAGVLRSVAALRGADLVFAILDASQATTQEDANLLEQCDPARTIIVRNKIDKPRSADCRVPERFCHTVEVSALTGAGMEALAREAEQLCETAGFTSDEALLATQRQAQCAADALAAVKSALSALLAGYAPDAVSVCLEDAVQALFSLTGERAADAVVDEVFASFCVGK